MDERTLTQFSLEVKALECQKSRSICEYCGCNHAVRLRTEGLDYLIDAEAGTCYQYIRDMHSEIRAIKKRLGLESD